MHNYLLPELCTLKSSSSKAAVNLSCYTYNNVFAYPLTKGLQIKHTNSLHYFDKKSFKHKNICQSLVKGSISFNPANQGVHLQNSIGYLIIDQKDIFRSYLAAKGNYYTINNTFQYVYKNAKSTFSMSYSCWHSEYTLHKQLQQKEYTLFSNCVSDNTGRFYIKTLLKNQSKKSIPENKIGRTEEKISAKH